MTAAFKRKVCVCGGGSFRVPYSTNMCPVKKTFISEDTGLTLWHQRVLSSTNDCYSPETTILETWSGLIRHSPANGITTPLAGQIKALIGGKDHHNTAIVTTPKPSRATPKPRYKIDSVLPNLILPTLQPVTTATCSHFLEFYGWGGLDKRAVVSWKLGERATMGRGKETLLRRASPILFAGPLLSVFLPFASAGLGTFSNGSSSLTAP